MSALDPLRPKIAKLVRLLATDNDGERLGAVNAIERTLDSVDASFHDMADIIENPHNGNGSKFSQEELTEVYTAGFSEGFKEAENKRFSEDEAFRDTNGGKSWKTMALYCQSHVDRLYKENEKKFINDMASRTVPNRFGEYTPSEKQTNWLASLYYKLGGAP